MTDLRGYLILLVETEEKKTKLFGLPAPEMGSLDSTVDEIVQINGKTVADIPQVEIIQYIHQCVKTRTICLRVKRKTSKTAGTYLSNIQEAYVIAVDDEAHQRLEQFTSLQKINTVDMTKIPADCSSSPSPDPPPYNNSHEDDDNQVELNPIYSSSSVLDPRTSFTSGNYLHQPGDPTDLDADLGYGQVGGSDMNGFRERDSPAKGEKHKKKHKHSKSSTSHGSTDSGEGGFGNPGISLESVPGTNGVHPYYGDQSNPDDQSDLNGHDELVEDSGPHREMAVDCPESFVGASKAPPVYPPPSTPQSAHTMSRVPNSHAYYDSQDSSFGEPVTDAYSYTMPTNNIQPKVTPEQLERLHRHQDDLRKRREEENRMISEQEFLRTSLRGSKKLQALESSKRAPMGVVNSAFDGEDNGEDPDMEDEGQATLPLRGHKDSDDTAYMKKNLGLEEVISSLDHLESQTAEENPEEIAFLAQLFQNAQFQHAVETHQKVIAATSRSPPLKAESNHARELTGDILGLIKASTSPQAQELRSLLQNDHVASLMLAHDRIAIQETSAGESLPEDDFMNYPLTQYGEETVKIVHLEKTNEPLGATVRNEGETVIVGRIVKGGTAEKSGLLHEGDEILEINGIDMRGKSINEVSDMLANMTGTITFMIIPNPTQMNGAHQPLTGSVMHVKAHFNYDPEEDIYIPCRELGISFMKGDFLHVINQDDVNWWQAYREGEEEQHTLAGLIPSKTFQEQREATRQTVVADNREMEKKARKCACGKKSDKKKKKKSLYAGGSMDEATEIQTYEEVVKYYPQPNRKRPIVLVGAPNVGRHELRQRLMESDCDRFAAAVPHTSRIQGEGEVHGKDYYFVPRQIFEADILGGKFVEQGEFEKNLYGTTLDAIRHVINQGKICILNLDPDCLRIMRSSDLKPYVIFVYPANLEKLRQIRRKLGGNLSDDELKDIIEKSREMDENYGHYFDSILVNSDMDRAYEELLADINRLEVEFQWVPKVWMEK